MTQNEMILNHMQRGRAIDPLTALNDYGVMRLAARIHNLRAEGHEIHAIKRDVHKRNGEVATICIYRLMKTKGK